MKAHRSVRAVLLSLLLTGTACPGPVIVGATTAGEDEAGSESDTGGEIVDDFRTYLIGESTKFDGGGGCNNANLNTVTNTLRNRLDNFAWSGLRLVNGNTLPEDFRDPVISPGGLDGSFADAARLAIYAGHGNVGVLQWGTPSGSGACQTNIPSMTREGTLTGNTAATVMFMTSCTLRTDVLTTTLPPGANASRQFFGYHNSPYIGYDEAQQVFKRTQDGQSSKDAWLEEMDQNISGRNSPVAVTWGTSPGDAMTFHSATSLATGVGLVQNVGEPADNFFLEWFNNGCSPSCGNCAMAPPAPFEITVGDNVPIVELSRPRRTPTYLRATVTTLLPFFGVDQLSSKTHARLNSWAKKATQTDDVTYTELPSVPRISLSYDPWSDRLKVTDLDALEFAQPMPGETPLKEDNEVSFRSSVLAEAELLQGEVMANLQFEPLLSSFDIATREAVHGDATMHGALRSIPFEYIISVNGSVAGLSLPEQELRVGVTRFGELSSVMISEMEVNVVGQTTIMHSPATLVEQLVDDLEAQYPALADVDIEDAVVGYVLLEEQTTAVIEPAVLVNYSLRFADPTIGSPTMVSRRYPVKISLTSADVTSLAATDPTPDSADDR